MPINLAEKRELERQYSEEEEQMDLVRRMYDLQRWYPEWFNYSDTLGERPIDGMMRQIQTIKRQRKEAEDRQLNWAKGQQRIVEQNEAVAPEYTNEVQQGLPVDDGIFKPMGRVM